MLMMPDTRLAEITERLVLWRDYNDAAAFTPREADELLGEANYLRRQHEHDVKLLRRCRDELIRVNDHYQDLLVRAEAWAAQEREERDFAALVVQDQSGEDDQTDQRSPQ